MLSQAQAIDALKAVIDPDIGINIVDLGMVERVATGPDGIDVALIMTTPACPQSGYLQDECLRVLSEAQAEPARVEVLELPLWDPSRLSDSARQALGW
jgi:metal-sulfur cluster biosynthetic enzyme